MEMSTPSPMSSKEKMVVEARLRTIKDWPKRRAFLCPKICYGTEAKNETSTAERYSKMLAR